MVALAGCALLGPKPLPVTTDTVTETSRLKVDPGLLPDMPLGRILIDPAKGLDPTAVAILAVLNSPDLKARRAAAKVAGAQVFAAGLLPDPQISLSMDIPTPGQMASTAYGIAPSLDVAALITHSAALKAARESRQQTDLDVLWAEWAVAQQARMLAETILADEAKSEALVDFSSIADERSEQSARALLRGDLAAQAADADLAVRIDADSQAATAQATAHRARLDLNALIGLQPDVQLRLVPERHSADWSRTVIAAAQDALTRRRPDLLALQAGYRAQQANLQKAVLAQFPLLNLGLNHAQDNTGILSNGPTAAVTLPVFRSARGPVAVAAATRDQLLAEYQSRLDQTEAETAANLAERDHDEEQARRLSDEMPKLASLNLAAREAWRRGEIDGAAYVTQAQAYLNRLGDLQDRRLSARVAEIALEATLFLPPAPTAEARP